MISRGEHRFKRRVELQSDNVLGSKKRQGELKDKSQQPQSFELSIDRKRGVEFKDRPERHFRKIKMRWQERYFFTEQMAMLLDAGVGIVPALELLEKNGKGQRLRYFLKVLKESVVKGEAVSSVLKYFPRSFSALYVAMVRIGEESGQLPDVFIYLAKMEKTRGAARKAIQKATFYPLMVLLVAIAVVVFIMIAVVPTFETVYSSSRMELPMLTQKVMHFSAFLSSNRGLYTGLMMLVVLLMARIIYRRFGFVKMFVDQGVLKQPLLGDILRNNFNARICEVLAIMLKSGVPLVGSLTLFQESVTNQYLSQKLMAIKQALARGESFSEAAKSSLIFTDTAMTLISVGEMSGRLEVVLEKSGNYHRERVENQISMLITLIDPLSMVLIGSIVGVILIALYLPMFSMGMTL